MQGMTLAPGTSLSCLVLTVLIVFLSLFSPSSPSLSATHVIAGLETTGSHDVLRDGRVLHTAVRPDALGVLRFESPGPGTFRLVDPGGGDTEPPAGITDLVEVMSTSDTIVLAWTAPGDDGNVGTAAGYEVRWGRTVGQLLLDPGQGTAVLVPSAAGTREHYALAGVPSSALIWVTVRARDAAGNWGEFSNLIKAQTTADLAPPASITDLRIVGATPSSIILSWTAPGDDGIQGRAAGYEIRWAVGSAMVVLLDAEIGDDPPVPAASGSVETYELGGLIPDVPILAAVRAVDEVGNWGEFSPVVIGRTSRLPGPGRMTEPATPAVPTQAAIERIFPNPVRTETAIRFIVPDRDGAGAVHVRLDLIDISGRLVERLVNRELPAGVREITWRPGEPGARVRPGTYFAVLRAGGQQVTRKITVVR